MNRKRSLRSRSLALLLLALLGAGAVLVPLLDAPAYAREAPTWQERGAASSLRGFHDHSICIQHHQGQLLTLRSAPELVTPPLAPFAPSWADSAVPQPVSSPLSLPRAPPSR